MPMKLPPWAVDNAESVRRESEEYRDLTPEQRAERMLLACDAAMMFITSRPDAAKVWSWRDPLPRAA